MIMDMKFECLWKSKRDAWLSFGDFGIHPIGNEFSCAFQKIHKKYIFWKNK